MKKYLFLLLSISTAHVSPAARVPCMIRNNLFISGFNLTTNPP